MMKKKLVLASSSPRRRNILEQMGLEFEIIPSDYDEVLETDDFTYGKVEELAYNKAKSVFEKLKIHSLLTTHHSLILGADTVVVLNKKILGKPKDEAEAIEMLKKLSGKTHFVVTSICVIDSLNSSKRTLSTKSLVEFNVLSDELIKGYVSNYKPLDKAGSYGIQELPDGFIANVEGSFENIIGLCSEALVTLLKDSGYICN